MRPTTVNTRHPSALLARRVLFLTGLIGGVTLASAAQADYGAGLRAYTAGNYRAAASQWQKASRTGDVRAMLRLGKLYESGQGVGRNRVTALAWYRACHRKGSADCGLAGHFLGQKLSAGQRQAAEQQAQALLRPGTPPRNGGTANLPGNNDRPNDRPNNHTNNGPDNGANNTDHGGFAFNPAGMEIRFSSRGDSLTRDDLWRFWSDGRLKGVAVLTPDQSYLPTREIVDIGRWRLAGGKLCLRWKQWQGGREVCYSATHTRGRWHQFSGNGTPAKFKGTVASFNSPY